MKEIRLPNTAAFPQDVFTQQTFDLAHQQMMSWQQAPGAIGGLHLHACWGDSSVMTRRYQGQTISWSTGLIRNYIRLHELAGDAKWRCAVEDVVSNVLFLQADNGGFYHASSEYEPTYTAEESCPIHQALPILTLLEYARWPHADRQRRTLIHEAIERHWRWFENHWWMRGNTWKHGLDHPGFCGVTNQDLVVVAALALNASVFGDEERYQHFGAPTLDAYLSPRYYHEHLGLFERGDRENFAERCAYYDVIVPMLNIIDRERPDGRIPRIVHRVTRQLFEGMLTGEDGMMHIPYGALTLPDDKTAITGWVKKPYSISAYPGLLHILHEDLNLHPDPQHQKKYDALERTLAAYVSCDGTLALLAGGDPLFSVVSRAEPIWHYLIRRLGKGLQAPQPLNIPTLWRTCGELEYRSGPRTWAVHRKGERLFAGLKCEAGGILIGNEENPAINLCELEAPQITERIESNEIKSS